ncbi:hypothetical protein ACQB60_32295 [Actinomycetota bacterium Odt1-20B]
MDLVNRPAACHRRTVVAGLLTAAGAMLPGFAASSARAAPWQLAAVSTDGWKGTEGGMTGARAVCRAPHALRRGGILQMHVGTPRNRGDVIDAWALPRILDATGARGYRVIDLRTLLSQPTPTADD